MHPNHIIFRGKTEDGWVKGSFLINKDDEGIDHYNICGEEDIYVEVYQDSIGQFTGLYAGSIETETEEIFEGDIIQYDYLGYVYWNENKAAFHVRTKSFDISLAAFLSEADFRKPPEIIGNIFDNPDFKQTFKLPTQ